MELAINSKWLHLGNEYVLTNIIDNYVQLERVKNGQKLLVLKDSTRYNSIFKSSNPSNFGFAMSSGQGTQQSFELDFNKTHYFKELTEFYSVNTTQLSKEQAIEDIRNKCHKRPETLLFCASYAFARYSTRLEINRFTHVAKSMTPMTNSYTHELLKHFISAIEQDKPATEGEYRDLLKHIPASEAYAYIRTLCAFEWHTALIFDRKDASAIYREFKELL